MKIAIISDIHDNIVNLKKAINYMEKNNLEKVICCGDVANQDTIKYMSKNIKKEIYLVSGNADIYNEDILNNFKNINFLGKIGRIEIDNFYVGICHEPWLSEKVLEKGDCDIVFYGHTHKPWIENKKSYKFVNPGTLGGMFSRSTMACWDIKKSAIELIIIDEY